MNNKFELHVLSQIYDFLIERVGFNKQSLHLKVLYLFREIHVGEKIDFNVLSSNKISGNFGDVSLINLLNVPHFNGKDKFINWAYKSINLS